LDEESEMGITCKGKIKVKGEVETEVFLNSGSDYEVLPRNIAEKISPKLVGEEEFILADGRIVRRKVYEVEVEIEDHKGRRKSCRSLATIEERPDVLIGFDVMEKLRLILNPAERKAYFSE
jgi:predicted aspartyl protease